MATQTDTNECRLPKHVSAELSKLVWGPNLKDEVFQRWTQGFIFSEDESTALVQLEGGPCAVIVPVQAFLLYHALFQHENHTCWREASKDVCDLLLTNALSAMLEQSRIPENEFFIIYPERNNSQRDNVAQESEILKETESSQEIENENTMTKEENFHSLLWFKKVESYEEAVAVYQAKAESLSQPFAVLAFLYSVLLTKGVDQIKNELEDPNEPLVDGTYGHGSQSLINLMLTGRAVSNVWDNEKDISGLKLRGISKQSTIGFLTLLEHLRYCEVGWFLKSPHYPIWIIGSETHLTILFSKEKSLVSPETSESAAKRIFKTFDPEGNNFISTILLGDVLKALELYSDPEYVEVMKQKLDAEGFGIILLSSFMQEFFPNENDSNQPRQFIVYHYNGLKRAAPDGKVIYQEGNAMMCEDEVKCVPDMTPILKCLQTKWPGIEVQWTNGTSPSII